MCKGIGAPTRTDNNLTPSQLPYGLTHYVENDKLGICDEELIVADRYRRCFSLER